MGLWTSAGRSTVADAGLLALRLGAGGMMAGHGAQKLFGSFAGPGLGGMSGFLGSLGLRPAKGWAALAGASEFGGGTLLALGLGGPIGPIALQGAMVTASRQVHWKLPIWVSDNGAELNVLYSLIGVAVAANGPGRYSLDRVLGVAIPRGVGLVAAAGVAAGVAVGEYQIANAKKAAAAVEPPEVDTGDYVAPTDGSEGGSVGH